MKGGQVEGCGSRCKGFAASTGISYVGVIEDKFGTYSIFHPIHLTTNDGKQGFRVNEHFNVVLLNHFIELRRGRDIFQMIGHPRTPLVAYTYTY